MHSPTTSQQRPHIHTRAPPTPATPLHSGWVRMRLAWLGIATSRGCALLQPHCRAGSTACRASAGSTSRHWRTAPEAACLASLGIPTLQATTPSDVRKLNKSPGFFQVPPNNLTALQKVRVRATAWLAWRLPVADLLAATAPGVRPGFWRYTCSGLPGPDGGSAPTTLHAVFCAALPCVCRPSSLPPPCFISEWRTPGAGTAAASSAPPAPAATSTTVRLCRRPGLGMRLRVLHTLGMGLCRRPQGLSSTARITSVMLHSAPPSPSAPPLPACSHAADRLLCACLQPLVLQCHPS